MSESSPSGDLLAELRQELDQRRAEIREVHQRGLSGAQVSAKLATLLDTILIRLLDATLSEASGPRAATLSSHLSVVCLGSHGRRQCSPFSDVDLMFLYKGMSRNEVAELLRPMTQGVFDIGLDLGSSIRKPAEAVQLAREDTVICTSLIDARFLKGDRTLFEEFRLGFEKMAKRYSKSLCKSFLEARAEERNQYGESVYLLEPHVKRSRGGIRDINLLRWLGFAEFGESDPDRLHLLGAMSKFDHHRLLSSSEYLLRLRNEMHFHAGAASDMLDRAEQLRIADWLGFQQRSGLLPVEQFMRDYFRHTNHIWQMVRRREASLLSVSTASRVLDPLFGKTVDGDFRVGMKHISATPAGLARVRTDLREVLQLVELSAREEKPLDQPTYSALLLAAPDFPEQVSVEVRQAFYEMLADCDSVGRLLALLHELGYLEKLVPAMQHARYLLQFNQYHKYTVDEHSLRAVREAASFANSEDTLGQAYREVQDKRVLHMALLLHDLGKGFEEDHSEVGRRIAEETAELFQLDEQSAQDIVFLVHKHLVMSHLTFRRDTSDIRVLEGFARQIGNEERLRMLYVMTCADLAAVGPDVLTDWKRDVLADVYLKASKFLRVEDSTDFRAILTAQTAAVLQALTHEQRGDEWYVRQLEALPASQLVSQDPQTIVQTLARLRPLAEGAADAWCQYNPETKVLECFAGVSRGLGRGVFSSMAGALSSEGLEILAADVDVLGDDLLILRFTATESQATSPTTPDRLAKLSKNMLGSLESDQPPQFRRVWGQEQEEASKKLTDMTNEVRIDTSLSAAFTIIEVFTFDRTGLLYSLARKLHDLGMSIRHAKIGTFIDQVVDVFYVTNREGRKVTDEGTLGHLKHELMQVIEEE
ncbi:[protein-PII] uridylyltransferase family protein [Bythopirellula polymerisocia]|uniref:Bifunctional uridylyltransferase/uridylyl-removing enzyme n=1 Tax=Bythopirellula polymerisocia TaxID=2528003 RepID=A0A5C6CF35_9BACT|nr:HD domain-containing protein [Bythopirellula polymerisocia]TWU22615.1 Bifunctional uridylyltransferase/uridylyl-removing enzyme [Bythopirellula polymerisocia]